MRETLRFITKLGITQPQTPGNLQLGLDFTN